MASCMPFASGTAKKPTPECCEDTKKVKATKPKCLCVLIKESSDPSFGLPVNTTLALQIPSACSIDAKVSDCPNTKIFTEASADSPAATSSSSTSPTGSGSTSCASGSSSETKATPSSSCVASFRSLDSTSLLGLVALMAWIFI